jgi:hypothetical protein
LSGEGRRGDERSSNQIFLQGFLHLFNRDARIELLKKASVPTGRSGGSAEEDSLRNKNSSRGEGQNSCRPFFGIQMPKGQHRSREYDG